MNSTHQAKTKAALIACGLLGASFTGWAQNDSAENQEIFELSPFIIDASLDEGYYASQTMAGGRLNQSLKNTGAAIQVVTKEFMDDIGATSIEELLQYTTSSEVAGILGNFTGAVTGATGETSTGEARRDPDGTARIRGLAAPDRTRNFFVTDIPLDSYNTERVDINRGANSFLFGLGSPAGLVNSGLARARFRHDTEISTRIGSGGDNPSYRGSFGINRVLIEDKLAIRVNGLVDRTQYRQRPTYENDDRIYTAFTFQPFGNSNTVIRGHMERGEIIGNAPDVLLPQEGLSTFLDRPVQFDTTYFARNRWNREGIEQDDFDDLSEEEQAAYLASGFPILIEDDPNTVDDESRGYDGIGWSNGAWGFVWDGSNGRNPGFTYTDQIRGNSIDRRTDRERDQDEILNYWSVLIGRNSGSPRGIYAGNLSDIKGTGWLDQGFTNLDTFDFSRSNLGWDNDFYSRDLFNYNLVLQQSIWEGKGGFEIAFDYQDLYRDSFTAFNAGNAVVTFDTNQTLLLPQDPNYIESGNYDPLPNPNFARPMILTKAGRRVNDEQREALRFTGFVRHDFADSLNNDNLAKILGNHTFTILGDENVYKERLINYSVNAFGDPDPVLSIGASDAQFVGNSVRQVPNNVYIGPPQPGALEPGWSLNDFTLTPADYDIRGAIGKSFPKLYWDLGPDYTYESVFEDDRAGTGNEQFLWGTFTPLETPDKNVRRLQTTTTSLAVNSQSEIFNKLLIVNMGYRKETVETFINTEPILVGRDEIPDVSPENWDVFDGNYIEKKSSIFGYGGVLRWPKDLIQLPESIVDITLHYNDTQNFVPETTRVNQYREPLPSPTGTSIDYGISFYMFEDRFVARINWFDGSLSNATAGVSGVFNSLQSRGFQYWGRLSRNIQEVTGHTVAEIAADPSLLVVDPDFADQNIVIDPDTGLDDEFDLPFDEAVLQKWGNLQTAWDALAPLTPIVEDPRIIEAYNLRFQSNGDVESQSPGNVADTQTVQAKGMEAAFIFNPSNSWRIAFNAAQQKVVIDDVAPRLGKLVDELWAPYLAEFGHLDWGDPTEPPSGDNIRDQTYDRLLDYYVVKGEEGKPTSEQREWRFNFVTNYFFQEGKLRGFSVGGAARWQDKASGGFPISWVKNDGSGEGVPLGENSHIEPDVLNPFYTDTDLAIDLIFGYRKKIFGNIDWKMQVNLRNVHNWDNADVDAIRFQPNGSVARARFAPPRQIFLTNTFRF